MEKIMLVFLYIFTFLIDFLPEMKQREKKERWLYVTALISSFIVVLLNSLYIHVPNPTDFIEAVVTNILSIFQ